MADIPKSIGINPYACTPAGISTNFENIIREIVNGAGRVRRFRLTENLSTGESAAAVILKDSAGVYTEGEAITVFDHYEETTTLPRGMFQAVAPMEGYCVLRESPASGLQGDIIWMEQYAWAIEFTLTSAFSGGTATATVDTSWGQGSAPGSSVTVHDDQDNYSWAAVGDKGVAWRSEYAAEGTPETPYYKVIEIVPDSGGDGGSFAPIVFFRLHVDPLPTGGSALARIVLTGDLDGTVITVHDRHVNFLRGMFQAPVGATGFARRHPGSVTDYDIIWMSQFAFGIEAELDSDLHPDGFANATVTASWHQGIDPGGTVVVHDDQGLFPQARTGAKLIAWRSEHADAANPAAPYYKIVQCQQVALTGRAVLAATMCAAGEIAISNFVVTSFSPFDQNLDPGTAFNDFAHKGKSGDSVWLAWDDTQEAYVIIDVTKKEQQVVFDIRLQSNYIQTFESECAVEYCEDPVWVDKIPVDPCTEEDP